VLGASNRLEPIRKDLLTSKEAALLYRKPHTVDAEQWTAADIPLLDEADAIINGTPQRYQHIVVDKAQDLSPTQLRALARRSNGSMTVHRAPEMAPGVEPPQPVRDGDEDPHVWQVTEDAAARHVVAQVRCHRGDGISVGVICPVDRRPAVEAALIRANIGWSDADRGELSLPVTVASPEGSKGLEFDAVIVLDPAGIAVTRTTQRLDVIDVETEPAQPPEPAPPTVPQQATAEGTVR
jgi:hypothetical protein